MTAPARILIAGVGNIFFGDDAFGVEAAHCLAARPLPEGVRVMEFGIRGWDLAFCLCRDWDAVILLDAAARGQPPGAVFVLELQVPPVSSGQLPGTIDSHRVDPAQVLRLAAALGARPRQVYLVGCEPADITGEACGLSQPVRAALDHAVQTTESLLQQLIDQRPLSAANAAEPGTCTSSLSP